MGRTSLTAANLRGQRPPSRHPSVTLTKHTPEVGRAGDRDPNPRAPPLSPTAASPTLQKTSQQLRSPYLLKRPKHPLQGDLRFKLESGSWSPSPSEGRRPPPHGVGTVRSGSSEGAGVGRPSGESAPSATERAGRSTGPEVSDNCVSPPSPEAPSPGWAAAGRRVGGSRLPSPGPALPGAGSAASSDGPGTQKPQLNLEKRCGAECNPSVTGGDEGRGGGRRRGRGGTPAGEVSTRGPQIQAENETSFHINVASPPNMHLPPNLESKAQC